MHLLHLGSIWEKWKKLSHIIGAFMGRVWLTLFYFTIVIPFALIIRFTINPFKPNENPEWQKIEFHEDTLETAGRQG